MTSALWTQLLTFVFTVFGGVLIFIFSQAVLKLVIEPVQQLKAAIGQTANTLLRYQAKISNAIPDDEVAATIKGHAADLMAKAAIISGYGFARWVFGLPTKVNIQRAAQELNLIGYGLMSDYHKAQASYEQPSIRALAIADNSEALPKIGKLLNVSTTYA